MHCLSFFPFLFLFGIDYFSKQLYIYIYIYTIENIKIYAIKKSFYLTYAYTNIKNANCSQEGRVL